MDLDLISFFNERLSGKMVVTKSELNSNRGDAQEVCATHGCISWNDWSILQEGNQICGRPWVWSYFVVMDSISL